VTGSPQGDPAPGAIGTQAALTGTAASEIPVGCGNVVLVSSSQFGDGDAELGSTLTRRPDLPVAGYDVDEPAPVRDLTNVPLRKSASARRISSSVFIAKGP
jgi:hypothetical protein